MKKKNKKFIISNKVLISLSMIALFMFGILVGMLAIQSVQPHTIQQYFPTINTIPSYPTITMTPEPTITPTLIPSSTPKPPDYPTITATDWKQFYTQIPLFTPFTLVPINPVVPVTPDYGFIVPTESIPTQVVADVPVVEPTVDEFKYGYYDKSLYNVWSPYVEPTLGVVVHLNLADLDKVFDQVTSISRQFPDCIYPLQTPFATWDMIDRLSKLQSDRKNYEEISIKSVEISQIFSEGFGYFPTDGNIRLPENDVIQMLINSEGISACKQSNDYPSFYGQGLQNWLNNLYYTYKE